MTLRVACVVDRAYVPHCGTMLQSLVINHRDTPIEAHVLYGGDLTVTDVANLQAVARGGGAHVDFVAVDAARISGLPVSRRFPAPEWYRLLLPDLLAGAERVLCLDCDLVVLESLQALWNTELGTAALGAVTDPLFSFHDRRWVDALGVRAPRDYFNSGVLLMNLAALRRQNFREAATSFVRRHSGRLPYPYQDTANALLQGRWHRLHPRWNVQTTFYERPPEQLPLEAGEVEAALARPAVMHYLGPWKPWHYRCKHPRRELYARYRAHTPWAQWEPEGRTLKDRVLHLLPESWARRLARGRAALGL